MIELKDEIRRAESFQVKVYRGAAHLAKVQKVESLLDLGCGYPVKLEKYLSFVKDIVGVDLPVKINLIENANFGEWKRHDFNKKKLRLRRKFDMIIAADIIEHLTYPDILLESIKDHSHEETIVLISTPEAESTLKTSDGKPANRQHKQEWKISEFINYLVSRGFQIVDFGCYIESNGAYPYICDYFLCRVKKG
jgi:2-polyprenyl-3-methyl-5-hydroxy-6-metoxy-1,4-benzoquinol methylase